MEVYELESCVRGHHVYERVWRATVDEQLDMCDYEYSQTHTVQSQNWQFLIWRFLVFLAKFSRYTVIYQKEK